MTVSEKNAFVNKNKFLKVWVNWSFDREIFQDAIRAGVFKYDVLEHQFKWKMTFVA